MFHFCAKGLLVVVLTLSLGFHWAVLQSVAWVSMVVKYSETSGFQTALSQTFDGQHPCKLCQMVKQGQEAEKKTETKLDTKKLDFFTAANTTFHFAKAPSLVLSKNVKFPSRLESPPSPPPWSA